MAALSRGLRLCVSTQEPYKKERRAVALTTSIPPSAKNAKKKGPKSTKAFFEEKKSEKGEKCTAA